MKTLLTLLLGLSLCSLAQAQKTYVQCGSLIDPAVSMDTQSEKTVVISAGRVESVQSGFTEGGNADRTINLQESTCMPGLGDMHVHITGEGSKTSFVDEIRRSEVENALMATRYAQRTLLAGFTTVRDNGGASAIPLRNAINRGAVVGPRIFAAGTSLSIMGGHGDPTNGVKEELIGVPTTDHGIADGVDGARKAARLAIKRGADHIKITATGGVLSVARDGKSPQFFEDEIRAIVEVADGFGMKVTAHAHGDEGMQRAVRAGVKSIEHGTYMSAETMALMSEKGAWYVPTITAGKSVADSAAVPGYFPEVVRVKAAEIGPIIQGTFGRAWEAGVPIAFGTDAGVFPHGKNGKEFGYMVEAGMPMIEAIKSATVNAAELLDQTDNLGSLESGKFADMIAVDGDPLLDPGLMESVSFVMKGGVVYKMGGAATGVSL